jgi:hypothetical protein
VRQQGNGRIIVRPVHLSGHSSADRRSLPQTWDGGLGLPRPTDRCRWSCRGRAQSRVFGCASNRRQPTRRRRALYCDLERREDARHGGRVRPPFCRRDHRRSVTACTAGLRTRGSPAWRRWPGLAATAGLVVAVLVALWLGWPDLFTPAGDHTRAGRLATLVLPATLARGHVDHGPGTAVPRPGPDPGDC